VASIKRRGSSWQATVRVKGREVTKTFPPRAEAERWAVGATVDAARGQFVAPLAGKLKFAAWAERWVATTTSNRPSTRARDESYLRTHILPSFGDYQLAEISHIDVRAWVAELAGRRAPATVQKAAQILSKIMATAVDARLITSNPCDRVPLPRVEREEMRFLTPAEVDRLAGAIDSRYRALVLVSAYGGLRIGELAGLRRGRVAPGGTRVDVAEICVEVSGHLTYGPPKTRAGRRSITLPRSVAAALNDHLAAFTAPDPAAFVFTAPEGGPLRVPAWRRRAWAPAIASADVAPLRPHDLRHTAVALWIATGANVLEVSRRAGHTSTAFTMDRYGHLYGDADRTLADRLDALAASAACDGDATVTQLHP
jgi:integrase